MERHGRDLERKASQKEDQPEYEAKLSLADTLGTDEVAQAIAAAAGNAKLTPASPNWADVEAAGILQDLFVNIAQGGDVAALAAAADEEIEAILNS